MNQSNLPHAGVVNAREVRQNRVVQINGGHCDILTIQLPKDRDRQHHELVCHLVGAPTDLEPTVKIARQLCRIIGAGLYQTTLSMSLG